MYYPNIVRFNLRLNSDFFYKKIINKVNIIEFTCFNWRSRKFVIYN